MFTYGNKNWGKEPGPGDLNQMIEIVSPISEINDNGYPVTHDTVIANVWAQVTQSGDSTNPEAGGSAQATALNFAIRYLEGICPGMVVIFGGERYEIVAVGGFDFRRRFIGMKTVRTGVIGL